MSNQMIDAHQREAPAQDEFTVAILCPLAVELAPVLALLDQTYPAVTSSRGTLTYHLGQIGDHKVVVATLPKIGTTKAGIVVTQLLNDFASVRFGLLVGIGGGIPSEKHDIRLGDVVVSDWNDQQAAVVQLDFGRRTAGGHFKALGSLQKPPTLLLDAVQRLGAQGRRQDSMIAAHLDTIVENVAASESSQYRHQGSEHDFLFQDDAHHTEGEMDCEDCDQSSIIDRLPRYHHLPKVFYGPVGSSNAVIQDVEYRSELRDQGFLCVEMEAAGIMDEFPCLVVRGICDYCDSHKNHRWQPYAAATAAAYTKALLLTIAAKRVQKASFAVDALPVRDAKGVALQNLNQIWNVHMSPPTTFTGRGSMYRDMVRACVAGGLDSGSTQRKVFVLHGMAGSGKTTLCLKFAEDFRHRFWAVFWVDASSEGSLQASLRKQTSAYCDAEDTEGMVSWLSDLQKPWLLVLDNADDPQFNLGRFIPVSPGGLTLITTRVKDSRRAATLGYAEVGPMTPRDASNLLLRLVDDETHDRGDSQEEAFEVVDSVGYLPLAIVHAGAYLRKGLCTMHEYPSILQRQPSEAFDGQLLHWSDNYMRTIYATMELSLNHIRSLETPVAEVALKICPLLPFLHSEGIAEVILERLTRAYPAATGVVRTNKNWAERPIYEGEEGTDPDEKAEPNGTGKYPWTQQGLREAWRLLESMSLITINHQSFERISIHAVVRIWFYERLSLQGRKNFFLLACCSLSKVPAQYDLAGDTRPRQFLQHSMACLRRPLEDEELFDFGAHITQDVGVMFENLSRRRSAKIPGAEETVTWLARQWLPLCYKAQGLTPQEQINRATLQTILHEIVGEYKACIRAASTGYSLTKDIFGSKDKRSMRFLLVLAEKQFSYASSEESMTTIQAATPELERADWAPDEATVSTYALKAFCHYRLGEIPEARQVFQRARDSAAAIGNMSITSALRDTLHSEALGRLHEGSAGWKEALGSEWLVVPPASGENAEAWVDGVSVVAAGKSVGGDHAQAAELYHGALTWSRALLGEKHPTTLNVLNSYAGTIRQLERFQECMELAKQAYHYRKEVLGPNHFDTLWSMGQVGMWEFDLRIGSGKLDLLQDCHRRARSALGPSNPVTLLVLETLVEFLGVSNRIPEALEAAEILWRLKVIEGDDDATQHTRLLAHLINWNMQLQRLDRILELSDDAERVLLAEDKPWDEVSHGVRGHLAVTYSVTGYSQEAVALGRECFRDAQQHYEDSDYRTIGGCGSYCMALVSNGQIGAAIMVAIPFGFCFVYAWVRSVLRRGRGVDGGGTIVQVVWQDLMMCLAFCRYVIQVVRKTVPDWQRAQKAKQA